MSESGAGKASLKRHENGDAINVFFNKQKMSSAEFKAMYETSPSKSYKDGKEVAEAKKSESDSAFCPEEYCLRLVPSSHFVSHLVLCILLC